MKNILLLLLLALTLQANSALSIMREVYENNTYSNDDNFILQRNHNVSTQLINLIDDKLFHMSFDYYSEKTDSGHNRFFVIKSGWLKNVKLHLQEEENKITTHVYVPSMRKTRNFPTPSKVATWNGSAFNFGDLLFTKPADETHIELAKKIVEVDSDDLSIFGKPSDFKAHSKEFTVIQSTPIDKEDYDFNYDYRLSYVYEGKDYKIEYFKDGTLFKTINKHHFQNSKHSLYWLAYNHVTKTKSLIYMPLETQFINNNIQSGTFNVNNLKNKATIKKAFLNPIIMVRNL